MTSRHPPNHVPPAQHMPHALNDFYLMQLILKSLKQPSLSDLITVQTGHKSPFMTQRYVQLVSKDRLSSKEDGTLED